MEPENTTGAALPGDAQLTPSDAATAVGSAPQAMTLDEINQFLGKQFTTKEAALKSWKDTNSYVGAKVETIEANVRAQLQDTSKTDNLARELEEMRKERFFDKNPQYAEPNARKLIEQLGGSPAEVVERPEFKAIFSKAQGFDENQTLKTVLESNPRLASSRDNLTKASELRAQGASTDQIESLVVTAVKDAYGMK